MSTGREYELYEENFSLEKGDRILLTSDGFHRKILRRQISLLSASNPSFDNFWSALQDALSEEILDDDASCLALEMD